MRRRIAGEVDTALLAMAFLTQLPVPARVHELGHRLGPAVGYFPLVGTLLGLLVAALDLALTQVLPNAVVCALDLAAFALLTGAFHLDGLMDCCDGLWGGRTPERRLEIMRDSRVGSFGVVGGVLLLLTQYSALGALEGEARTRALILAPTIARWVVTLGVRRFPYVRSEGRGSAMRDGLGAERVLAATAFTGVAAMLLAGPRGLAAVALGAGVLLLGGGWISRRLGGMSGDAYGALNELTAALTLVALVAHAP